MLRFYCFCSLLLGFSVSFAVAETTEVCLPAPDATLTPELRAQIAQWLDWKNFSGTASSQAKVTKGCAYNLCGGTYEEPVLEGFSAQLPYPDDARVSADQASLSESGSSLLTGNVVVVQPGKEMTADTAYIYRDPKTKEITQIDLFGNVSVREQGKVMYAQEGHYLPQQESGYVDNVIYRMSLKEPLQLESNELLQAWGRAVSVERDKQRYYLEDATFTTCPPKDSSWQLKAKKMILDKETGRGEAEHAFLDVHDVPIFYFPYYNFPIDDRRQTGFLTPSAGYSNISGWGFSVPYYWNIAPNYDLLLTPNYYTTRGVLLDTDFRYLTEKSQGELKLNGIYHDQAFEQYIQDNQAQLDAAGQGDLSDNRYEVYFHNGTRIDENWSMNAHYHYVSDDYYLQNFGSTIGETTENQLLQEADIDYKSEHWNSVLTMLHYQTLQPINQTAVSDVYSKYPSWTLGGNYANLPGGVNFNINNEYDNFVWTGDDEEDQALGGRYHTNPVFSRPIMDPSGYITPTVRLQETYYGLSQNPTDLEQSMNILVPQTSVDSSIYFDRSTSFWGKSWTQTLEPRVYYLYVPYVNQTQVPNFDSNYQIFTYDQLFRPNRFSGIDRVGDANQTSLALMSRFLDADSGAEVFHWGIGETFYFEDRDVQLMQLEPGKAYADSSATTVGYMSPTTTFSPIASQISYHFTPVWSLVGDGAWDPTTQMTNNATVNLHYQPGVNKLLNLGYSYLVNGDQTGITDPSTQNGNLNQTIFSYAWPISPNHQWSTIGSWTENISHNYAMGYSLGIQYEDCCWAVRFVGGKIYSNLDNDDQPVYNNGVYLQILLKGLGGTSVGGSTSVMGNIPGYQDIFNN